VAENEALSQPKVFQLVGTNAFLVTRDALDTVFAGYPVHPKAGYRISGKGRISGRILGLTTIFLVKYQINL
jgi:hypothetical protein